MVAAHLAVSVIRSQNVMGAGVQIPPSPGFIECSFPELTSFKSA